MGLDFDVLEFCKKLRLERPPPYQCPLEACEKVYKSLCGLQYHLVNYDHDNPTPMSPTTTPNRRKGHRARAPVPTGDIALQSPPKEALTFAEAQKVVQFEIDGKISRICIDRPLPVMSLEEWESRNAQLERPLPFVEPPPEPHVKLPEATYKLIPEYRLSEPPPRPNAYIRFIEKSAEELDGEVEYDVDEEDTAWLGLINKMRVKQGLPVVSVDTLELLMDRLEKESYFQAAQNGQQPAAVVDEEAVCCICTDGECQNTNVILFCDMCNLAVHQDCYGVPYIPEGQWLCRRCLQSPSRLVNCVLCPNTGGAFKQTDQGTWAHVVCALWIPEVRFANTVFLEPIDSIEMIPMARWKLQCMVCKQRGGGACIQCHKTSCYSAFHVTCAQQAGLYMKMDAVGGGRDPSQPVQVAKMAYCDAHTPAHILQERRAQVSEGGDNSKKTDLSVVRQKGRDKIKQARRVLAMKRTWAPVVLVPTLAAERVAEIAQLAGGGTVAARAQLLKRLLAYWSLKRRHRNGVPLLRRLQSLTTHHGGRGAIQDGTVNTRELCNQLKYWQRIRQDLERARLLCELVRKRERMKAEYARVWERCLMHTLRPERAALHKLLRQLHARDTSDIFSEPVDPTEVPDYSTVVKHPMDLSTMVSRLEQGVYHTIDDVEKDFGLMIDNCLAYNNKDTVFYKAGVKMREQCAPLFRSARRDVRRAGLALVAGAGSRDSSAESRPGVDSAAALVAGARSRRERSMSRAAREPSPPSPRPQRRAASVARRARSDKWASDTDDDDRPVISKPVERSPKAAASGEVKTAPATTWRRGRGRGRGRWRGRGRGRLSLLASEERAKKAATTETATSGSETPAPRQDAPAARSPARSPAKSPAKSPSKSPAKLADTLTPQPVAGLGLLGQRKTTLGLPLTPSSLPSKSFGSDVKLPTLSSSLGIPTEEVPKKKGRGRPRKHDKNKPNPTDKFRALAEGEAGVPERSAPVPASFLQYRGPPGEAGSDSDVGQSRSSSSSSAWSCSSCTHYDDDLSDHSCSSSSTGGRSSYNETLDSTNQTPSDSESRGGVARRGAARTSSDRDAHSTPGKGRGTRSSSKTPVNTDGGENSGQIPPLSLVWAKCRGYPWYPALIIDQKMPKGYVYNGVPLPVPPQDVLNLKRNMSNESILHLVLFFDAKRTWQWLPRNKLELLGIEKSVDQSKLVESRKPTDRKAVKKAYGDAMQFRKQVNGESEK